MLVLLRIVATIRRLMASNHNAKLLLVIIAEQQTQSWFLFVFCELSFLLEINSFVLGIRHIKSLTVHFFVHWNLLLWKSFLFLFADKILIITSRSFRILCSVITFRGDFARGAFAWWFSDTEGCWNRSLRVGLSSWFYFFWSLRVILDFFFYISSCELRTYRGNLFIKVPSKTLDLVI